MKAGRNTVIQVELKVIREYLKCNCKNLIAKFPEQQEPYSIWVPGQYEIESNIKANMQSKEYGKSEKF